MYTAITDLAWGDCGKGRLTDYIGGQYKYHARFNGGANAGHTVYINNKICKLHLLPCGILKQHTKCIIGPSVQIDINQLLEDIKNVQSCGINVGDRLFISELCHIVQEKHKEEDVQTGERIGTTHKGIGPCNLDKINRIGIRLCDLRKDSPILKKIGKYIYPQNTIYYFINLGHVLFEGANGCLLDIDCGTYPYVTSNRTTLNCIADNMIYPANKLYQNFHSIGVIKAYMTRVGNGPFPTEIFGNNADLIREKGKEFGTTTGRARRIGWLDIPALLYSIQINNPSCLALNCLDVLSDLDEIWVCEKYSDSINKYWPNNIFGAEPVYKIFPGWKEDISSIIFFDHLPFNAQVYIGYLEKMLCKNIKYIGVGKNREQMIVK